MKTNKFNRFSGSLTKMIPGKAKRTFKIASATKETKSSNSTGYEEGGTTVPSPPYSKSFYPKDVSICIEF